MNQPHYPQAQQPATQFVQQAQQPAQVQYLQQAPQQAPVPISPIEQTLQQALALSSTISQTAQAAQAYAASEPFAIQYAYPHLSQVCALLAQALSSTLLTLEEVKAIAMQGGGDGGGDGDENISEGYENLIATVERVLETAWERLPIDVTSSLLAGLQPALAETEDLPIAGFEQRFGQQIAAIMAANNAVLTGQTGQVSS